MGIPNKPSKKRILKEIGFKVDRGHYINYRSLEASKGTLVVSRV
jgi:hypothetical protein